MNLINGESYEIQIEKLIYGGDGLGRINNQAVFVPFAAPGDHLQIRITQIERNFARGVIEKILTPAPVRRAARCQHFGVCGGCQLQHLDYAAQLQAKTAFIRESLRRIGKINWDDEIEIIADNEFGYRARAEIKINQPEKNSVGFFQAGSHEICAVTECPILLPAMEQELKKISANPALIARAATRIFLTAGDDKILATAATGENARAAEIDKLGTVQQTIAGINFTFGVRTFFQANRLLVEKLITTAIKDVRGKIAFDLFAGAGLFSLPLAQNFAQVYAVEGSKISVAHGLNNAQANQINNVTYDALSVEAWLKHRAPKLPRPDFVLLDPPRAGAGAIVINRLLALKPKTIHYVSCNPTTLARDLQLLVQGGYAINSISAVDMFPQTFHIETVVQLTSERELRR